jgi:hypothetical protein
MVSLFKWVFVILLQMLTLNNIGNVVRDNLGHTIFNRVW